MYRVKVTTLLFYYLVNIIILKRFIRRALTSRHQQVVLAGHGAGVLGTVGRRAVIHFELYRRQRGRRQLMSVRRGVGGCGGRLVSVAVRYLFVGVVSAILEEIRYVVDTITRFVGVGVAVVRHGRTGVVGRRPVVGGGLLL